VSEQKRSAITYGFTRPQKLDHRKKAGATNDGCIIGYVIACDKRDTFLGADLDF